MARHQLNVKEKTWIVKHMYRLEYPINVQRLWSKEINNNPPDRKTIRSLMHKFEQTGSVLNIDPPGRPVSVIGQETKDEVSSILKEKPRTSLRQLSTDLNISMSSVRHIYKSLGFKPYIPRLIHELNEDDPDRRIEYCETFLSLLKDDSDLMYRVIWSDEAVFKLNGHINRHNSVYWATQNPNVTIDQAMQVEGLIVWAGIRYQDVIGPYFFETTVTSQSYIKMLDDYFYPLFCDVPDNESFSFMHDRAPAHYASIVRDWLDEKFPARWIGRRGALDWPARSPDLTPADFFLWGYLKDIVYQKKHRAQGGESGSPRSPIP
ncbi:unnamed protein product [Rotaria magnacalcarata]|uniref:DUF4817 domain-containing protein n=1 Tax=Rotaria magnacalcarata TaxID=392030 RepID=A0A820GIV0_9BILA|nr:unnamed protein product [Rotaria magnacalcarata]CAF2147144.1 unnamed protein product [Rotaria magnacalcarata]CAF4278738.1 unnamed protein product [Rotaria magnacalcarata]CAF4281571.1 unnamed protein product [Rotaria magnacalcarata]